MKKYVIALFFAILLFPVLLVGFSQAKYMSANTLSFQVTFEEDDDAATKNEVTLVTGSELNAMIKELVNPACGHLGVFFGTFDEYYESVVGAWDNCSSEYYAAVDARGNRSDAIRVFQAWDGYRVYVLAESGFEIAMNPDSSNMFSGLSYLAYIDGLLEVDTSQVKNMRAMFKDCSVLSNPELGNFNTEKVTDMREMFSGCKWCLTELDLSSFVMKNVTRMDSMFAQCGQLRKISVSEGWDTEVCKSNDDMFDGCVGLFGQKGTSYKSNYEKGVLDYASITYARVDGGPNSATPGYLTYKANSKVSQADLDEGDADTEQENTPPKADEKPQTSTATVETATEETETVETTETGEIPPEETLDELIEEETPEETLDEPIEEETLEETLDEPIEEETLEETVPDGTMEENSEG